MARTAPTRDRKRRTRPVEPRTRQFLRRIIEARRLQPHILAGLVGSLRLRADDVTDACLAAVALEAGATFVTRGRVTAARRLGRVQDNGTGERRAG